MISEKKKIVYLDVLRALATFAVILNHVAGNNWNGFIESNRWGVFTFYKGLSSFCVPIFLMISGALFLQKDKSISIKRLYSHNILRLIIFLLFWSVCYQIYNFGIDVNSIKGIVKNIAYGQTQIHLWFIYMIIGIYVCVPVLKVFTDNAPKRMLEYLLIIFFVFTLVCFSLSNIQLRIFKVIFLNISRLDVRLMSGYIGYFILGHYLNTYEIGKVHRKIIYVLGIISMLLVTVITVVMSRKNGVPVSNYLEYLTPFVCLWSMAVFVYAKNNFNNVNNNLIEETSKYSLGIYAIHMFVVFELWKHNFSTFSFNSVCSVPVLTLIVFLVSFISVKILYKIPIINRWII